MKKLSFFIAYAAVIISLSSCTSKKNEHNGIEIKI